MTEYTQLYRKEHYNENSKNINGVFNSNIITNILFYFILLKNNSYSLLSHLHLTISNLTLSQSIYNLVKKKDKNDLVKKNLSDVEKFVKTNPTIHSINFNGYTKYIVEKITEKNFIKKKYKCYNELNNFDNINNNTDSNDEWGWFVYFE